MTPSHPMHLRTPASIDKHVIAMLNRSTSLLEHRSDRQVRRDRNLATEHRDQAWWLSTRCSVTNLGRRGTQWLC
jgi:hypothetical protein